MYVGCFSTSHSMTQLFLKSGGHKGMGTVQLDDAVNDFTNRVKNKLSAT